jgi:RNA polymerase sigma factor (sigma-70 family)
MNRNFARLFGLCVGGGFFRSEGAILGGGANIEHDDARLRLYLSHRAALIDYATPLVGDRGRAEDVVQDAFLKFVPRDGRASATPISRPVAYLYRIVRNLALDLGRQQRRRQGKNEETPWWLSPAESRTAEQEAMHGNELKRLRAALDALPDDARFALELHRFGGYTLQEIADQLNISVPSVHRLVRDALVQVATSLALDEGQSGARAK